MTQEVRNQSLFAGTLTNLSMETVADMVVVFGEETTSTSTSTVTLGRSSGVSVYSFGVLILFLWVCLICYLSGHTWANGRQPEVATRKASRPVMNEISRQKKLDFESIVNFDSRLCLSELSEFSSTLNCYMDAQSAGVSIANLGTVCVALNEAELRPVVSEEY